MAATEADVLIRGAGPVGCTLALALRGAGLSVALHDAGAPRPGFRPLALSHATRLMFERLAVWQEIPATAIERIVVSQAGTFGRTRLDAADAGVPALGYVAEYSDVVKALRHAAADLISSAAPAARWIVHAEGTAPEAGKRYAQDALVALVRTEPAATTTAHERFTPEGPLALLPHAGGYAIVWSMRPQRADELAAAPDGEFLFRFAKIAGAGAGRPVAVQSRSRQPLALNVRETRVRDNEVYIGNAAQSLHPVAGQGLNLGLRDAWELASMLRRDGPSTRTLERFAAQRRLDAGATIRLTDFLAGGFAGSNPLFRAARGAALTALDIFPAPRRFFARRMIFGARAIP